MKHTPYFFDDAERAGFSLMVSGHTHQGQFFPFNLVTKWIYKGYDFGFKKYGTMDILVSSGAGTWGPPIRVGTATEIVVISL
jgi:predicted MPP superfamily phosphohydrolase